MKKTFSILGFIAGGLTLQAQSTLTSTLQNPYYLIAILLFVVLIAIALILPTVIKALANQVKEKKNRTKNLMILLFGSLGLSAQAQDASTSAVAGLVKNIDAATFMLILACIILVITFLVMFKAIFKLSHFLKSDEELAEEAKKGSAWANFMKKMTDAKEIEEEGDILLDHDYDGIKELDNNLPPWWVGFFYLTILFGAIYVARYYVMDHPLQTEEYNIEVAEAQAKLERYKATATNLIDETTVTLLNDGSSLEAGAKLYKSLCATCHGPSGEGLVGPNLTDEYWLHGGDIKAVFSTIKYGVPEKGMIPWKSQLKAQQMQNIASYILNKLQGTNPTGAKAPEGDKYVPVVEEVVTEQVEQSDSTSQQ